MLVLLVLDLCVRVLQGFRVLARKLAGQLADGSGSPRGTSAIPRVARLSGRTRWPSRRPARRPIRSRGPDTVVLRPACSLGLLPSTDPDPGVAGLLLSKLAGAGFHARDVVR